MKNNSVESTVKPGVLQKTNNTIWYILNNLIVQSLTEQSVSNLLQYYLYHCVWFIKDLDI